MYTILTFANFMCEYKYNIKYFNLLLFNSKTMAFGEQHIIHKHIPPPSDEYINANHIHIKKITIDKFVSLATYITN